MPLIVVKSQIAGLVKEIAQAKGVKVDNIAGDFAPELDKKVKNIIEKSVERAAQNNRKTLMGRDV